MTMETEESSQKSDFSTTEDIATIKEVFIECQESNKSERFVVALQKLYAESDETEFFDEFRNLLCHVFVHVGAETPVNRIFKVVINFILRLDNEHSKAMEGEEEDDATLHPFVENTLNFLLEMEDASCHAVRIRALHLMSILFKELNELPSDGEFWDSLYEMAASRLSDTSATVRAKAVSTFCYLQDPSSPACPIIKDFLFLISRDPSFLVRRNLVSSIAVTSRTLSAVKMRLRDVNSSVRKTALLRISEKVSINCFTPSQRMEILNSCVNDLSNDVKLAVKQHLIPSWFKMCKNDIFEFLGLVQVQAIPEVMQKVLNIIFETKDVRNLAKGVEIDPESHLISMKQLTVPQAFLWRCLCQFVKTMNVPEAVDFFDEITPTISDLSAHLEEFLNTMESTEDANDKKERCFIFEQIVTIAAELDFSDIVGEKRLHALIVKILNSKTCSLEMVKPLVVCLKSMELDHREFLQDILDIVSEIHKPVFTEDPHVRNLQNFLIVSKALQILIEAWKFPRTKEIFLEMSDMKDHVIMPVLKHEDEHIRRAAVEALGLYSAFDVEEARANYSHFMEAIMYGELEVQITALKIAFDILMIFGFDLIADLGKLKANDSTIRSSGAFSKQHRLAKFVEKLMPLLESESQEIVHVAAEGLAKVMIAQRISSPTLFFKLCIMRYDPANEANAKLKFCIAAFMPEYAQSGALTAECVKETVVNILNRILDADEDSELSDIDGMFVLKTLIKLFLLIPRQTKEEENIEGCLIHDDVALIVCNKILQNPNAGFVPSLIKVFNLFVPTSSASDELISAVERVRDAIKIRRLFKIVNNFYVKINETSIVQKDDDISLAKRQLSFSQNSQLSTEASSETPSIMDVPSNEDILSESSTIDILLDESDSSSEDENVETDPRFAEYTPDKRQSKSNQNDISDEIIIPESPECQQGNDYGPTSMENQLGANYEPGASSPGQEMDCVSELADNLKMICVLGSGEKVPESSYGRSSPHEQKMVLKHEPMKSEQASYKVGSSHYDQKEKLELVQSALGDNYKLISESQIKKSSSIVDQLEKSCDDAVFLSSDKMEM